MTRMHYLFPLSLVGTHWRACVASIRYVSMGIIFSECLLEWSNGWMDYRRWVEWRK